MAVAFDAISEDPTGTTMSTADPHTFTHTPAGTPAGVLVLIATTASASDTVSSVTYGGTAMARIQSNTDAGGGETARTYLYFLGSSVPASGQTVSIDKSGAVASYAVCMTVTAGGNTEIVDNDGVNEDAANPSVTLSYGGRTCLAACVIASGLPNVTDLTKLSDMSDMHSIDIGARIVRADRQTSPGTSDFTIGYTSASDDVAFSACAISEVAAANITMQVGNVNIGF